MVSSLPLAESTLYKSSGTTILINLYITKYSLTYNERSIRKTMVNLEARVNETLLLPNNFGSHFCLYLYIVIRKTIRLTIRLLTKKLFFFLYVGRLPGLQSSKDDFEEPFDDTSGRQSRRVECKRTSRCQKSRTSTRLRSESSQTKECKNSQTVTTFLITTV